MINDGVGGEGAIETCFTRSVRVWIGLLRNEGMRLESLSNEPKPSRLCLDHLVEWRRSISDGHKDRRAARLRVSLGMSTLAV